ncbi:MAG TPA: cell division protein FtsZ, partial [Solirubrobacteraceae bacterium]|nr:cell division protein FtsZ [Solirubrobacteraceae bacterium]
MANAKRASMREGPLAALFRKTEGDEDGAAEGAAPETEPERRDAPGADAPAQAARAEAKPPRERPQPAARERALPHPALSASPDAPAEPARVPSPQERLRHAFSSEIPENVMEPQPTRPVMDDYAR